MASRWLPYTAITERMVVALAAGALAAALWRGADYLALPQSAGMSVAEKALPIAHWGALIIIGVLLAVLGYLLHRWPVTIMGHALLAGIFAALGVGEIATGLTDIAGDSLRAGVALLCVQAVLHAELTVVAWRRWDAARG
ncbi:MAG: hypothetical protein M3Y90_15790 [Actinomycetota bacterium]|nr:hypothetical protein [Actinomycetota bacterium]